MRPRNWAILLAIGSAFALASVASADVTSDRAAAILMFPKVAVGSLTVDDEVLDSPFAFSATLSTDTLIQISNTSTDPAILHCFYLDASSHCSTSGLVCDPNARPSPCPEPSDLCLPSWTETDFQVVMTPRQPIAWRASAGLLDGKLPLDGVVFRGPGGESNAGTRVPPVAAEPAAVSVRGDPIVGTQFIGELKCVVVDQDGRAVPRNVIKGEATVESLLELIVPDIPGPVLGGLQVNLPNAERYNAVGVQAIEGDANGDGVLELGGTANEYNGCANTLIFDHFFDFTVNPVDESLIQSDLTLVPCSQDLRNQVPGSATAQFLVYNEFEQRFSTSRPVQCYFESPLSNIDTRSEFRSIFSVFVAGTPAGQTRVRGVGGAFAGILRQRNTIGFMFTTLQAPLTTSPSAIEATEQVVGEFSALQQTTPFVSTLLGGAFRSTAQNSHLQGQGQTDRVVLP